MLLSKVRSLRLLPRANPSVKECYAEFRSRLSLFNVGVFMKTRPRIAFKCDEEELVETYVDEQDPKM
jgi:hypothetical protein